MFEILRKSLRIGIVTTNYPKAPPEVSSHARGRPEIDWTNWKDARPAAAICPTGAIVSEDKNGERTATLDLGKCIFCGLCADVDKAIRMTNLCECAARKRSDLITSRAYTLKADGSHDQLLERFNAPPPESLERIGNRIKDRAGQLLGRS